jgi:pimeloyl-ACP methyl ester carboxylesterase
VRGDASRDHWDGKCKRHPGLPWELAETAVGYHDGTISGNEDIGKRMTTPSRAEQIREESLWFGPTDQPLFGRLTTPICETTNGAVLLSPPIGRESRLARRAFRTLAIHLARDGYVSLRYDHFGTGDSSGTIEDKGLDRAWIEGVDQGVGFLRSLGIGTVSAVGMRLGATIVGAAASLFDLELSSFAMWDPCESGHAYVRELIALGALGPDITSSGFGEPTQMLEYALSDDAEKRLDQFSLIEPTTRRIAERVLVVTRDDRAVSSKFRSKWDSKYVEWATTTEQGPLLEPQLPVSVSPESTIASLRKWLTMPSPLPIPFTVQPQSPEVIVSRETNEYPVRERVVSLGSSQMFGIVSEPVGETLGPTIVMVNGVNEDHVGPARLWVELARRWASLGLRCVRFDLSELGESPWIPGQPVRPVFDSTRRHDIVGAVQSIEPMNPSNTVLIGYCSGAQLAIEVAAELKTRGVCVINPEVGAGSLPSEDRLKLSARESTRSMVHRAEEYLKRHRRTNKLVRRVLRLALSLTYPPKMPRELVAGDSDILLLLSPDDLSPLRQVPVLGAVLRGRLVSLRNLHIKIVSGLDHSMLSTLGRRRVVGMLDQFIIERYVRVASQSPSAGDSDSSL